MVNEHVINPNSQGEETIIYQSHLRPLPAKKRGYHKQILGISLLFFSFVGFLIILFPMVSAELGYRFYQIKASGKAENEKASSFGNLLWLSDNNLGTPVDWQFDVIIPKIGLNAPVKTDVDANNQTEYNQVLKNSLAHAKGSSLPDQRGTSYIFGHSSNFIWDATRQNALFYLLKNVEKKDRIIVFYNSKPYLYQVTEKNINNAADIPDYVNQTDKRLLVLQTCWPPGTAWKRLLVVATPIDNEIGLSTTENKAL
ncbi:MAG: sortase [bacterium]|nr:sortase [bacterium]